MENKEIKLSTGVGNIKFGMSRDEIKKILGPAEEVDRIPGFDEEVVDELENWHYDDLGCTLVFDGELEWRLVSISLDGPEFTLNGEQIIGRSKDAVEKILADAGVPAENFDDYSDEENSDLWLLDSDEFGYLVWFDEGVSIEFQILPDIHEDTDEIIWPA